MKRSFGAIILIVSLALIGVGLFFLLREPAESQASAVAANTPRYEQRAWSDVKLPDQIPSKMKEYEGFVVSFNRDNGTPNYVAWELLGAETTGASSRKNRFLQDPELEGCPTTDDYKGSEYDRGHMCPAADQKWSEKAMEDCFMLTNICPQAHALNAGAWNTLESKCRLWAQRDSALWIVAGPIYEPTDKLRIGRENSVRVPSAFFKVIVAPFVAEPRGIAFVYPNMASPGNMQNYSMTIDQLEEITGYDFFPSLPDDTENALESRAKFNDWNRR